MIGTIVVSGLRMIVHTDITFSISSMLDPTRTMIGLNPKLFQFRAVSAQRYAYGSGRALTPIVADRTTNFLGRCCTKDGDGPLSPWLDGVSILVLLELQAVSIVTPVLAIW